MPHPGLRDARNAGDPSQFHKWNTGRQTLCVFGLLNGSMLSASQLRTRFDTNEGFRRLLRIDLPVDTVKLARYLVGKVIVHDTASGRLRAYP
jgi:hypothetical protein